MYSDSPLYYHEHKKTNEMSVWTLNAVYLDVVEYGCGHIGVQVDQSFLLQQLRQRAAAHKKRTRCKKTKKQKTTHLNLLRIN